MDKNFFAAQPFAAEELVKLRRSAEKYLAISRKNREPEVKFHFTYMALIKIGIYLVAKEGYRVKSRPGHHQMIIEELAGLLKNEMWRLSEIKCGAAGIWIFTAPTGG